MNEIQSGIALRRFQVSSFQYVLIYDLDSEIIIAYGFPESFCKTEDFHLALKSSNITDPHRGKIHTDIQALAKDQKIREWGAENKMFILYDENLSTHSLSEWDGPTDDNNETYKYSVDMAESHLEEEVYLRVATWNYWNYTAEELLKLYGSDSEEGLSTYDLLQEIKETRRGIEEGAVLEISSTPTTKMDMLKHQLAESPTRFRSEPAQFRSAPSTFFRDAVTEEIYKKIFSNAGSSYPHYEKFPERAEIKAAQLRLSYFLLYRVGIRVGELATLGRQEVYKSMKNGTLSIKPKSRKGTIKTYHFETPNSDDQSQVIKDIEMLRRKGYKNLFLPDRGIDTKHLIKLINSDLRHIVGNFLKEEDITIKTHSFRIGCVRNLLRSKKTVAEAAKCVAHVETRTTEAYRDK